VYIGETPGKNLRVADRMVLHGEGEERAIAMADRNVIELRIIVRVDMGSSQ